MAKHISEADKDARQRVHALERMHGGDLNRIRATLKKDYEDAEAQTPRNRFYTQFMVEIARAYAPVSDGALGIAPKAERTQLRDDSRLQRYQNAVKGLSADGRSVSKVQRDICRAGLTDMLTDDARKLMSLSPEPSRDAISIHHGTQGARPSSVHKTMAAKPTARLSVTAKGPRPE